MFFFFTTENDYSVRRHQGMGQNWTKSKSGRRKAATRAEDNSIRITSLCDRRLTAPNITAQLNQCREEMCQQPLRHFAKMQNCCQETSVEEAKQCQKAPVGQGAQRPDNRAVE